MAPAGSRRLMTAEEAAEMLALRLSTLMDYSRRQIVPSIRIGRHVRFVEADLLDYIDALRDQR